MKKNVDKTNGDEPKRSVLTKSESAKMPAEESKRNGSESIEMIEIETIGMTETTVETEMIGTTIDETMIAIETTAETANI